VKAYRAEISFSLRELNLSVFDSDERKVGG